MKSEFSRAYLAAVEEVWAIRPEWIPRIQAIASRAHAGLQAVEAERGEPLEYSYSARVREGVAILPVNGPIFRYANLYSCYSGGTSVSMLARDFNIALNDSRIHSIIFEFNSPGGGVTGINELAMMIYNARGQKPTTARAGGSMCSAAYWLGAACGDVVIDPTAPLGSIGVYMTYLDTKQADRKNGFREGKIVSDDSPDKCPDPTTPEGEKLLKAQVNAIAGVFIESAALFRDVKPEKVRADFGRGGVLYGQAAIDAGMADRFGSLEETIAELVQAHGSANGMNYTGALQEENISARARARSASTDNARATSTPAPDDDEGDPDEEESDELLEPGDDPEDEEEEEARGGDSAAEATTNSTPTISAHEPVTTDRGAIEMADQNTAGQGGLVNQETLAQLQAQLAEANRKAEENAAAAAASAAAAAQATAAVEALNKERRTDRLRAVAKDFIGGEGAHLGVLEHLASTASGGEEGELFTAYVEQQQAAAEQVRQSNLFREMGREGSAASSDSAEGKLMAMAEKLAKDKGIPFAQAFNQVCEENSALYNSYDQERRSR